jgi:hypothetical protein
LLKAKFLFCNAGRRPAFNPIQAELVPNNGLFLAIFPTPNPLKGARFDFGTFLVCKKKKIYLDAHVEK